MRLFAGEISVLKKSSTRCLGRRGRYILIHGIVVIAVPVTMIVMTLAPIVLGDETDTVGLKSINREEVEEIPEVEEADQAVELLSMLRHNLSCL